jgi:hypothetical protein
METIAGITRSTACPSALVTRAQTVFLAKFVFALHFMFIGISIYSKLP